jgi:hypothetical protein
MAFTNLHISEFSDLGTTQSGDAAVPCLPADGNLANQTLAVTGTSASSNAFQSASPSSFSGTPNQSNGAPISQGTKWVLLYADIAMSIAFGTAPVAAAGGWYMPAASSLLVRVPANRSWKVAAITDAT